MPLHDSPMLKFYFYWKPYQGANPTTADDIFIGEDANFAPGIEDQPIWPKLVEYLKDGVKFWDDHRVHHPFLLPRYKNGSGAPYHRWFDYVFSPEENGRPVPLPKVIRDRISFVEFLPWPTTGAKNIYDPNLVNMAREVGHYRALAGLIFNPTTQQGRTVFITKTVAEKLNAEFAADPTLGQQLPPPDQLNLMSGPWHQVFPAAKDRCRVVIHYHPLARFPSSGGQQLGASIRNLLLNGNQ